MLQLLRLLLHTAQPNAHVAHAANAHVSYANVADGDAAACLLLALGGILWKKPSMKFLYSRYTTHSKKNFSHNLYTNSKV